MVGSGSRNVLNLSVDRKLNESDGQWVTTFSARRVDSKNTTAGLKLEVTHSTTECRGNQVTHVEMIVKDGLAHHSAVGEAQKDGLLFHHRHNKNVVLFNGGKSAQRINLEDLLNSAVFTNRPLKDNEKFEVMLEKRYNEKVYCHGIGVMSHSPDDVKFFESMYFSEGIWMNYDGNVYSGKKIVVANYGTNMCLSQVGDTVGVMKRENGSLHFFMNGVDQGPAITNAPSVVYGVYEVRGFAAIASIVS
ncbi:neuralized-like protein 4 [Hetaerina americana]|uniref:neuralized-like protein 4 n=1 Tax=Hetaerina americana TaxID=62018 RepID=UPI003A7F467A